ncbi:hypothetical protein JW916_06825 [Candidatus Sumerlaeota bacterium]|nr:hypothetical protein [Candidatus Sumerlaeota bacterium]
MRRLFFLNGILSFLLVGSVIAASPQSDAEESDTGQSETTETLQSFLMPGELTPETFVAQSDAASRLGTRVARVVRRDELPGGPWASGDIGDYIVENEWIRAIVRNEKREGGGGVPGGGGIVDVALRDQMWDSIGGIANYIGIDGKFEPVQYDRISIHETHSGGGNAPAYLLLEGDVKGIKGFAVRTIMYAEPAKPRLVVATHCTNLTTQTVQINIVDRVCWGTLPPFVGAYGIPKYTDQTHLKTLWVCGTLDDFCLGIVNGQSNPISVSPLVMNTGAHSYARGKVPPGRTLQSIRTCIVSAGDMAPILEYLLSLKKIPSGVLEGRVTEGDEEEPVSDVQVEIRMMLRDEKARSQEEETTKKKSTYPVAFAITRPNEQGYYRIALPVGEYVLKTTGPGRLAMPFGQQTSFKIRAGRITTYNNRQDPPGKGVFSISDADTKKPIPGKVRFEPIPPTRELYLGPDWKASGARNVAYLAPGWNEVAIAGGNFKCIFSAGPEYEVVEKTIRIPLGGSQRLKADLKRIAPAKGMISVDLDVATEISPSSRVSAKDLVLAAAGEGVEWLISGDLNRVTDLDDAIASQGLENFIRASRGVHLSYQYPRLFGEFFLFPLFNATQDQIDRLAGPDSSPEDFFAAVRKLCPEILICVTDPVAIDMSYLQYYQVNSRTAESPFAKDFSMDFDALEVAAGKNWRMNDAAWETMESFTYAGYPKLPVASSRCTSLYFNEPGYPRLYVLTGEESPRRVSESRLAKLIRSGQYFLSNGPIIEQKIDDAVPTRTVTAHNGEIVHSMRVSAAPWVRVRDIRLNESLRRYPRQIMVTPGEEVLRYPFDEKSRAPYVWAMGKSKKSSGVRDMFFSIRVQGLPIEPVLSRVQNESFRVFAATPPIMVDGNGDGKFDFE